MTLFSPNKKEFYKSHGYGPGSTEMSFEEWQLASLTSRCLFGYENGLPVNRLAGEFDKKLLTAVKGSIGQLVGGETVMSYMNLDSPSGFYTALACNPHEHLKIAKFHEGGLLGVVKARCLAWKGTLTKEEAAYVKMHSMRYQL